MGWKSGHTLNWVLCLGLHKAEIEVLDRLHSHVQALPGMEQHLSSGRLLTGFISLMEKAVASQSCTLAWKIPWMEEPGRLQSTGLLGVGHDWATSLSLFTFMHWRRIWHPTPVFCISVCFLKTWKNVKVKVIQSSLTLYEDLKQGEKENNCCL